MNVRPSRATWVFAFVAASTLASAQSSLLPGAAEKEKPPKLSASAIKIEPVQSNDTRIPAEFRYAIYEHVIERLRQAGTFQKVIRSGDHSADGIPDLVTLHMNVENFEEGSQTKRELTTVLGATKIDIGTTVTARDGRTIWDKKIQGKVRFRGENLGATNDLAKHITKLLRESF